MVTIYKDRVVRLIRNGRVKIFNRWYTPSDRHMKYDGRLDGMKYLFITYTFYQRPGERRMAYPWGPEENAREPDPEKWIDDPQIVDGHFNWGTWYAD